MATAERELEVLESIYRNGSRVRQRDLAQVVGLSLGMTNAILKRLAHKGWLAIRKVNNRNIRYAVTPAGADEIARRSYRFLRRTIRNVVDYKEAIERLVSAARLRGFHTVTLVGSSDLDFILEHVCAKNSVRFVRGDGPHDTAGCIRVISERRRRPAAVRAAVGASQAAAEGDSRVVYLRDILA